MKIKGPISLLAALFLASCASTSHRLGVTYPARPHDHLVIVVETDAQLPLAGGPWIKIGESTMPTVVHWEDRATAWSGRPDRIQIEIRTVEIEERRNACARQRSGQEQMGDVRRRCPRGFVGGAAARLCRLAFLAGRHAVAKGHSRNGFR